MNAGGQYGWDAGGDENAPHPVGDFVLLAKRRVEDALSAVWVVGEIANFTRAASGHWYFVLRDERGQVDCVMLARENKAAGITPAAGDKVVLYGAPTLYAPRGRFQLAVRLMRPDGVGRLYQEFMRRKKAWQARGWFDNARPPPFLPRRIGVVCSLAGAAVRDVLRALKSRFPSAAVVIYPAPAQGEGAAEKIAAAVAAAGRRRDCDVLLVCRGGGGMEDLWSYNEEAVVAAIFASPIPVITGIGHEIDETLADYAADVRAPTPTAAAARAVPDAAELLQKITTQRARLRRLMLSALDEKAQRLDWAARLLTAPENMLAEKSARLRRLSTTLARAAERGCHDGERRLARLAYGLRLPNLPAANERCRAAARRLTSAAAGGARAAQTALAALDARLNLLSPAHTLRRGYSIVQDKRGRVLTDAARVKAGEELNLSLSRGVVVAAVKTTRGDSLL